MGIRDERKAATLEGIRSAALDLVEELGLEAVTVGKIAERAGISERTFFRYYESREMALLPAQRELIEAVSNCDFPADAQSSEVFRLLVAACRQVMIREVQDSEFRRISRLMASEPKLLQLATGQDQELVVSICAQLQSKGVLEQMPALLVGEVLASSWRVAWQCYGLADRAGQQVDPAQLLDDAVAALAQLSGVATE